MIESQYCKISIYSMRQKKTERNDRFFSPVHFIRYNISEIFFCAVYNLHLMKCVINEQDTDKGKIEQKTKKR